MLPFASAACFCFTYFSFVDGKRTTRRGIGVHKKVCRRLQEQQISHRYSSGVEIKTKTHKKKIATTPYVIGSNQAIYTVYHDFFSEAFEHRPRHDRRSPKIHTRTVTTAEHVYRKSSCPHKIQNLPLLYSLVTIAMLRPTDALLSLKIFSPASVHDFIACGFRYYHTPPTLIGCRTSSLTSGSKNPSPASP